jgi:hypothetical protein
VKSPRRGPNPEFDAARRSPVWVLTGLAVGLAAGYFAAIVFWPAAPILPFLLGTATVPFAKTKAFGLGAWAAACGVPTFLITVFLLFLI